MTTQGVEHIIFVLTECRSEFMKRPDPMLLERIQEAIVICREEIVRKKEDNDGV
jgi:hypothetical protein